jgi:hypothetical protein
MRETDQDKRMKTNQNKKGHVNQVLTYITLTTAVVVTGCASTTTSNTARTGTEQMLISAAIDRAMSTVEFSDFSGYKVFIDDKYLEAVDKGYLVGSIRHEVLQAGGLLAPAADAADLVLEIRSGGIGTDRQETFIGIPAIGIPGLPIELPEVKLAARSTQMGTAKLGLVCYDAKTGQAVGMGGKSSALTHNNDTFVMGIGPFRSGSVLDQRERSVGFNGVGGSFMSNPMRVARGKAISMVDQTSTAAPYSEVPQIAEVPSALIQK